MSKLEIKTWADLAAVIAAMPPDQKAQLIQIAVHDPNEGNVYALQRGLAFGTVGQLEIPYCRSSVDNRHHEEEFVIYADGNPHAVDGAIAYDWSTDSETPIYPNGHDESADWTGPAQKILNEQRNT